MGLPFERYAKFQPVVAGEVPRVRPPGPKRDLTRDWPKKFLANLAQHSVGARGFARTDFKILQNNTVRVLHGGNREIEKSKMEKS